MKFHVWLIMIDGENLQNYVPQKSVLIQYEMEGLFHVHTKDQNT